MTDVLTFHLFYPMLFTTIGVITIVLIFATKSILIKYKDNDSQNFRFKTHVEEHIDTTNKMSKMHDNVIKVDFTDKHEKELDFLEKALEKVQKEVGELNSKVDLLIEKVAKIEASK